MEVSVSKFWVVVFLLKIFTLTRKTSIDIQRSTSLAKYVHEVLRNVLERITLHKICENAAIYWPEFSRIRTESTIMYGWIIRISENRLKMLASIMRFRNSIYLTNMSLIIFSLSADYFWTIWSTRKSNVFLAVHDEANNGDILG